MDTSPILAVTMGDPAGIGPEIIAAGFQEILDVSHSRVIMFGHPEILDKALKLRGINAEIEILESPDAPFEPKNGRIPCFPCVNDSALKASPGKVSAEAGEAAFRALVAAIDAAKSGTVDAIVTAPLNKEALHLAGHDYPGHTEILAEKCCVDDFAMMLYLGPGDNLATEYGLAVVHVTLHTAMRNIFERITQESVHAKIMLAERFMRNMKPFDLPPRIGVCSLNPHAGESGLFGDEEIRIIRPAVETAISEGILVEGPLPADTIMLAAKNGRFDAIVAMFHDQGHIALKLLDMQRSVNVTLGLPIIRTSVAHGTAFDLAWKGTASPGSLIEAARVAAKLIQKH